MLTRSAGLWLVIVFAVATGTRVAWVVARYGPSPDTLSYPDELAYRMAGESLAAGHGLVDEFGYRATYMPAYPAFIAGFKALGLSLLSLRLTQAVLAALVAPATFLLARQFVVLARPGSDQGRTGLSIATLAGLAAAVDPFLVAFSGLLLTEALYAAVLVTAWWLVLMLLDPSRPQTLGRSLSAGLLLLGCVMLRPAATVLVLIVPVMIVFYRGLKPAAWGSAEVVIGVVVLGLLPWAARNHRLLGEWRWTTTRGGISLYDGFRPDATGASDLGHTKADPAVSRLGEIAWDRYWHDRAVAAIREQPGRAVALAGRKFRRTWNIVPNEPGHRRGLSAAVSAVWMVGVLALAAVGWWQVRRAMRWWVALLVPVAAISVLHMIFVGSVRYRTPVMPMLFVLAAVGLWRLIGHRLSPPCRSISEGTQH
jgi:hypothetical protein